jgi:hypothetical protein
MKLASAATGLVLGAFPALAEDRCPTGADMRRGVEIGYSDQTQVTFRQDGRPGHTVLEVRQTDGQVTRSDLVHGTFMLDIAPITEDGGTDAANRMTFGYEVAPETLPPPAPLTQWEGQVVVDTPEGRLTRVEQRAYGPLETVTIAGCPYEGFELMFAHEDEVGYAAGGFYIPELGFAVRRWNERAGVPRQTYAVETFRAVP